MVRKLTSPNKGELFAFPFVIICLHCIIGLMIIKNLFNLFHISELISESHVELLVMNEEFVMDEMNVDAVPNVLADNNDFMVRFLETVKIIARIKSSVVTPA